MYPLTADNADENAVANSKEYMMVLRALMLTERGGSRRTGNTSAREKIFELERALLFQSKA